MSEGQGGEAGGGRRVAAAAALLALSVLLSRVLGFVREMVLAARVGVAAGTDAYYAAFQIPDLLNYLLAGGALAIAFTPLYLKTQAEAGGDAARALFGNVLGTMGAIALGLTGLLFVWAEPLVDVLFPGFDPQTRALTVRLTRIVLPAQVFFVAGGIMRAVLMAHGHFAAQASAPLVYNAGIIVGGLIGDGVEGFAWGALGGAFLGTFLHPLIDLRKVGGVRLAFAPGARGFRRYLVMALPLMIGVSLTTVDEWYEKLFGQALGEGVVASLGFARRLMMAPVAVIGQAVGAAALPTLARLHSEGRSAELDRMMLRTLQATVAVAALAAAALFVVAEPFVAAMYRRGAFDDAATARVSALLALLSFAVPGWVVQQVAIRSFFARAEMWRPMLLGTGMALAAIPLYYGLGQVHGAEGLAVAGALAISGNALATVVWSSLRFGGPDLGALLSTTLRSAVIAATGGLVATALLPGGAGLMGALVDLLVAGGVLLAVAAVGVWLIGDAVMRQTGERLLVRAQLDRVFSRFFR